MIKLDEVKILHLAYFVFKNKEENTMIISIWKKQDLQLIKELPTEVLSAIETTIEILDEDYGTERTTEDLGGYVAIVDKAGIKQLKQKQLNGIIPEYIDEIEGAEYISALFLCSNDFSIVVIVNELNNKGMNPSESKAIPSRRFLPFLIRIHWLY